MKVLVEDLPRASRLDRLSTLQFVMLAGTGSLVAVIVGTAAARPENTRAVREQIGRLASSIGEHWHSLAPPAGTRRSTETRSAGCHPSYRPCLPIVSDVDCRGGRGNGPAFTGRVTVIGYDVYGLDGDGDGIGCE
ncbi:MAG: hypothetical protein EOP21_01800 [Hyphomicrobiales bacterium]|nr:MAG: hypothetical protein EOP21_01800 [Hyphomicrobiales bacterium]